MAQAQFLVHGRNHTRNAGKVGGQCIEEAFDNYRFCNIGLNVERNVCRARGVRNVRMRSVRFIDQATVNGVNQALRIAGRNRDTRFVVGIQVVQIKTDLVAFNARHHAEAHERFRVAAVIANAIKLSLTNAPSAGGQEVGRRRASAGGPVAVAHKVFENLGFFATDFLDPRMFILFAVAIRFKRS